MLSLYSLILYSLFLCILFPYRTNSPSVFPLCILSLYSISLNCLSVLIVDYSLYFLTTCSLPFPPISFLLFIAHLALVSISIVLSILIPPKFENFPSLNLFIYCTYIPRRNIRAFTYILQPTWLSLSLQS